MRFEIKDDRRLWERRRIINDNEFWLRNPPVLIGDERTGKDRRKAPDQLNIVTAKHIEIYR